MYSSMDPYLFFNILGLSFILSELYDYLQARDLELLNILEDSFDEDDLLLLDELTKVC
jgi:hypothetical protein